MCLKTLRTTLVYLNLFALPEHLRMLMTPIIVIKLLKHGYRYHKLRKAFFKFNRRHFELIEKYHVSLKKLLQQNCSMEIGYITETSPYKSDPRIPPNI